MALDGDIIIASLPVLDNAMTRNNACHHDSGANRHVFHDRAMFEMYRPIEPLCVKGFGKDLATVAIGRGTVRVLGWYGQCSCNIVLHNVLHIPAARSNLISGSLLDKAGISAALGDGLATLSYQGISIVGSALHNDMYRLNMSIIRATPSLPLTSQIESPPLISRLSPIAAAASSDQAGFYIA
jgi:hypothetical protein